MENQFSFSWLLKHCRKLIRTWSFTTGRISRWEYLVSYLIISLLWSISAAVLWQLGWETGTQLSWIIGIILGLFGIKLIIKRSHDIEKSGRYYFLPLFLIIAMLIIAAGYVLSQGLFSIWESNPWLQISAIPPVLLWVFGAIMWWLSIWFIIRVCMIVFKVGARSDNLYGSDPLVWQPNSNNMYRVVWLCALALSMIIWSFGKPAPVSYDLNSPNMQGSDTDTVTTSQSLWAPEDYEDTSATEPIDTSADTPAEDIQP